MRMDFFKAKHHYDAFPVLQVKSRQGEVSKLAAGSESNLLLSRCSTAPKGIKQVSDPPFYIFLCVPDFCRIHMSQSCGGLLFLEMLNAGFSDKGGSVVC